MSDAVRAVLDPTQFEIRPLGAEDRFVLEVFSCGDDDLDDFVRSDALRLQAQNVVRTYLAFHGGALVGYVALLSDAVELKPTERKRLALKWGDHPVIPALKVARLAVSAADRTRVRGIGTELMRFAYAQALACSQRVGCRLLTVDAYPQSVGFYERLGFVRNQAEVYLKRKRPSMRLDVFAPSLPAWLSRADLPGHAPAS